MSESIDAWLARIGTREAMEERHEMRLAGEINAQVRGVRGLGKVVERMRLNGFDPKAHRQRELRPVTVAHKAPTPKPAEKPQPVAKRKKPVASMTGCKSMTPAHGHKAKSGFKQPAKKWDERCSTCGGAGEIIGILGDRQPCPRCAEE